MNTDGLTPKQARQRGDVIRELRRRSGRPGLSDFAADCGLSAQSLTNIENEHRQASWEALHKIARGLAVPVTVILRDPDAVPGSNGDRAA